VFGQDPRREELGTISFFIWVLVPRCVQLVEIHPPVHLCAPICMNPLFQYKLQTFLRGQVYVQVQACTHTDTHTHILHSLSPPSPCVCVCVCVCVCMCMYVYASKALHVHECTRLQSTCRHMDTDGYSETENGIFSK
jgi:hypothetical protein